jgi:hypothetical protein
LCGWLGGGGGGGRIEQKFDYVKVVGRQSLSK